MRFRLFKIASVLLGALAAAACSTPGIDQPGGVAKGLTVKVETDARTSADGAGIVWTEGDKIALALDAAGSMATSAHLAAFDFTGGKDFANTEIQVNSDTAYTIAAIYPYSLQSTVLYTERHNPAGERMRTAGSYEAGAAALTQQGESARHTIACSPMYWSSTGSVPAENVTVRLHHTTALLDFEIVNATESPIEAASLRLALPQGYALCGKYYINVSTGALAAAGSTSAVSTVTVKDGRSFPTGGSFHIYMPVVPFALTGGDKAAITVATTDDRVCEFEQTISGVQAGAAVSIRLEITRTEQQPEPDPEEPLCTCDESALSVAGRGGQLQLALALGSEPCRVALEPAGWIENAASVTAGAGAVATVKFTALANLGPEERTATVMVSSMQSERTQSLTLTQANGEWLLAENTKFALPARWVFNATQKKDNADRWEPYGYIRSYMGNVDKNKTGGYISFVRADGNAAKAQIKREFSGNYCYANVMGEGDSWMFTLPGVTCEAGTAFDLYMTVGGNAKAPKYYIFEYYDNGRWCSNAESLYTAAEDASIKYSLRASGTAVTASGQFTTFDGSFRISQPLDNGIVYMRVRAVGKYAADGSVSDVTKSGSSGSGFAVFGYTGANVAQMSSKAPEKKLRVLIIGNSFSYYYHSVSQIKQIAYSEGVELDINAFLKGGRTFAQHLALSQSTYTVNLGNYDYAIIQDQSQNPALLASAPGANASVNSSCLTLAQNIRKASPQCKVILENTWAYPGKTDGDDEDGAGGLYGGFSSLDEFDRLLAEGSMTMARNAGTWISPVGQAFAKVRAERPDVELLYSSDNKHPNANGSYLKSCVNYLVMTGRPFGSSTSAVDIDAATASYLRGVAESVVLGHESEYLIER